MHRIFLICNEAKCIFQKFESWHFNKLFSPLCLLYQTMPISDCFWYNYVKISSAFEKYVSRFSNILRFRRRRKLFGNFGCSRVPSWKRLGYARDACSLLFANVTVKERAKTSSCDACSGSLIWCSIFRIGPIKVRLRCLNKRTFKS